MTLTWILSRIAPFKSFPPHTGPYVVGSCDAEVPISDLHPPSPKPKGVDIHTVVFRIFYPCEPGTSTKTVQWIPNPQRGYMKAYARYLGMNFTFSQLIARFLSHVLIFIATPAQRNAKLLPPPTSSGKWPVLIFSHGLGGCRSSYSWILGAIASHGVVVVAPDHRDYSAAVTYIRAVDGHPPRVLRYYRVAHSAMNYVYQWRDRQFRTRLWELSLVHCALLQINAGLPVRNLDPNSTRFRRTDTNEVLSLLAHQLDIEEPGSIIWAGHSFGAASIVQLIKSTYWRIPAQHPDADQDPNSPSYTPLFTPSAKAPIVRQITPLSPLVLLDMWAMPLYSPFTRPLSEKPLPCYITASPDAGSRILALMSSAFAKWTDHLVLEKCALCPTPSGPITLRNPHALNDHPINIAGPRLFYPANSAHLSQSDFTIVFPRVTKRIFKAGNEPERYLQLNVRAIVQFLRETGVDVAPYDVRNTEDGDVCDDSREAGDKRGDWRILAKDGGGVRGWVAVEVMGKGEVSEEGDSGQGKLVLPERDLNEEPTAGRTSTV